MNCPKCGTPLNHDNHRSFWDESADGNAVLYNEFTCPKCHHTVHDYEDWYEWLPDEFYVTVPWVNVP